MKRIVLILGISVLCFGSKAQSKDTLMKLHSKVVHYDNLYSKLMREAFIDNRDVDPDSAARIDSLRIVAREEYNEYWYAYHESKGDVEQKVKESVIKYERERLLRSLYFFWLY